MTAYENISYPMTDSPCRTYIDHQVRLRMVYRFRKIKSRFHLSHTGTEIAYLHLFLPYQSGKFQFRKFALYGISD